MSTLGHFTRFLLGSVRAAFRGNALYWAWVGVLATLAIVGGFAYVRQLDQGLISTSMRNQVSWGFYIGNFTFLVGVAAAAVLLVIPAYVYKWKPIKEVVVLGELLAIAAVMMCGLFVLVDVGRPDRVWELIPGLGFLNVPSSLLGWDVLVLNGYLVLNLVIATYTLFALYRGRTPLKWLFNPLVLLSIPWAIGIHTVTAFLYNGLIARPFWNSAILAPRFIASAFCSGPAVLLIVIQFLRRFGRLEVRDTAIAKVAELMAYAMVVNLFLLGAEIFTEVYSDTEHVQHLTYMFFGLEGHTGIVPWMWTAVACSIAAVILFLIPKLRHHPVTLNLGCVLIYLGVYLEKGMGLVIPGFTPDTLGEIYEYRPSWNEILIAAGIFAMGFLAFTFMIKAAVAIMSGQLRAEPTAPAVAHAEETEGVPV